jgi:hypothetical protein
MKNFKLLLWVFLGGNLNIKQYQDNPRYEDVLVFFEDKKSLSFASRQAVACFLIPSFLKVCRQYHHLKMKKREFFDFLNWKEFQKTELFSSIMPISKLLLDQKDRDLFTYENLSYQDLVVLRDIIEEYFLSTEKWETHEKFRNEFFKRVKTKKPES